MNKSVLAYNVEISTDVTAISLNKLTQVQQQNYYLKVDC